MGSRLKKEISATPRWLWPVQITVGIACVALAVFIAFSPKLGGYAFLSLAGAGLIILGLERIAAGVLAHKVRRSSRMINVSVGAAIIVWIGSGFFFPDVAIKWITIFFGFGLLANGILRIIDGLKRDEELLNITSLSAGVISIAVAIAVLVYPPLGFALLIVMTAVALAVSGIQVILMGARTKRRGLDSGYEEHLSTLATPEQRHLSSNNGIWKKGSWFMDDAGRYLLFRGVNFASRSKLPPYLPIAPLETQDISQLKLEKEIGIVKGELDLLKDLGFNIVRLLVSWKALEPRPNPHLDELLPEGKEYLEYLGKVIDALYARNLYVILDFHQDIAQEAYGGDGFPDWAVAIDKEHEQEHPDFKDKKWLIKYAINKSVKHTLRSFWRNDLTNEDESLENYPVRTHLEKTIGQTAKFFRSIDNGRGHPAILGIEPFNEPHPVGMPKEQFERELLMEYYINVNSELTSFNPDTFIFLEPRVDWTVSPEGERNALGPTPFSARDSFNMELIKNVMSDGRIDSRQITTHLPLNMQSISTFGQNGVLSFHYYDKTAVASSLLNIPESMYTYKREWPVIFSQLVQSATERGLIPFLTEFGGYQGAEQVREYMNLEFEQVEAYLLNATYWNYDLYHTKEGKDNWNLENYSLLGPNRMPRNLDIVARPYPMCSSAEPVLLFFNIESKYAAIVLKGKVVDAPTVVYVPFNMHYAPEFSVWATGREMKWDRDNQLLSWLPAKELPYNEIIIGKNRNLDIDALPEPAKRLADKISFVGTFV